MSQNTNRPIITMKSIGRFGRLGNQMFQWAMLRLLSKKLDLSIEIPIIKDDNEYGNFMLDEAFNVSGKYIESDKNKLDGIRFSNLIERMEFMVDRRAPNAKRENINIHGYFQCPEYFKLVPNMRETILDDFTFNSGLILSGE